MEENINIEVAKCEKTNSKIVSLIFSIFFLAISLIIAIFATNFTFSIINTKGGEEAITLIILLPLLLIYFGVYLLFSIPALIFSIKTIGSQVKRNKITGIVNTSLSGLSILYLIALIVILFVGL